MTPSNKVRGLTRVKENGKKARSKMKNGRQTPAKALEKMGERGKKNEAR